MHPQASLPPRFRAWPARLATLATALALLAASASPAAPPPAASFRAGAHVVDVAPTGWPVRVNGNFFEATADRLRDPLKARALVLDDGHERIALVVVDSCMLPRDLIDRAKDLARVATGLRTDRILVSATHTHSAPAAMGALGCRPDAAYAAALPPKIAEAVAGAVKNLAPAEIGWSAVDDYEHTHCRRWVRRPDRLLSDPFGRANVRANMHPGYLSPDVTSPAGPVDPQLSVLAVRTPAGRPIAAFANYSMHYFGAEPLSADYFGRFADELTRRVQSDLESKERRKAFERMRDEAPQSILMDLKRKEQLKALQKKSGAAPPPKPAEGPPFVVLMSQGTSGDQHWMDYASAKSSVQMDSYANMVAHYAKGAYDKIRYVPHVPIAMAEGTITLRRRVPDPDRLAWARGVVATRGDRPAKTLAEVYAQEAIELHESPERELKVQAVRVGELGITALPNEVFALTGLKIKEWSPFPATFNIELANGAEGYIPPPEQHALGGYTTWPARTAALEVEAEPKLVEFTLGLLEKVAGRPRKPFQARESNYARAILVDEPVAYYRLEDMDGEAPYNHSRAPRGVASWEGGHAHYLEGHPSKPMTAAGKVNRAALLAGGRLRGLTLAPQGTAELWFWNALPDDARPVTGDLIDFGPEAGALAIGGKSEARDRLIWRAPKGPALGNGPTYTFLREWHHLAVTRDGPSITVYLDGRPEFQAQAPEAAANQPWPIAFGGSDDPATRFEGKLDEIALFDRVLPAYNLSTRPQAAELVRPRP